MYCDATLDTFVEARSDSMPHNKFERILQNLYLYDKEQLGKYDKFSNSREGRD